MSELPVDLSEDALEQALISIFNTPIRAHPTHMLIPNTPYNPYKTVGVVEIEDE